MNTEGDKPEETDVEEDLESVETEDTEETIVMTEMPVADGGAGDTVELKVDKLIEKVESQSEDEVHRKKEIRRRLEDIVDEGSMEDTYAFDLEDSD